ncbi:MAG TPA: SAF domain-containing protein [Candidatus Saccharimonadales bacterium]|nr:SAF domain-containing protein [Candidatus Saccharimonadales bacterium]
MEYKDPSRRGRYIVIIGVILALVAGAAAFFLISQAQQQAGQAGLQRVSVVVALQTIPARKVIEAADLVVREIPIDPTNAQGIVSTPDKVIGRVPAVTVLEGQMVTTNILASSTEGGQFSILGADETIGPDSAEWRAISMTVPDDRAVGGLLQPNQTVDVFVTATINVLNDSESGVSSEGFYTDKSTKIAYQDMVILAKAGSLYILRAPLDVAEEISHLQASGAATFSMALRPDIDTRQVDASALGTTTNDVIIRYGLPIPVLFPPAEGPLPTPAATPAATPQPSVDPAASPGASAVPDVSASPAP